MFFYRRFITITLYCFLVSPFVVQAKINIVVTTTDLAAITQEIGGNKVEVSALVKGNQDPHFISPKPAMILKVNKADLLINIGASLEVGWLPALIHNSHNNKILTGSTGRIDASKKIRLLEVPTTKIDRSMGDVHPEGNPHYWLDPYNGLMLASTIAERLQMLDPENTEYYGSNFEQFRQVLQAKLKSWETRMEPYRNQKIVVYHKQWEYLINWFQLQAIGEVEPKPGIPPSPKHIASLTQQMQSNQVQVILSSSFVSPKATKQIAHKTGASLVILPTSVGGEKGVETYIDLFERIVSKLTFAFEN